MDFILPDELTTEKMRLEYEKILANKDTSVLSLGMESATKSTEPLDISTENSKKSIDFSDDISPKQPFFNCNYASTNILVLYFIFALGYNCGYGTSIFDTNISVGRIQSQERPSGNINSFFKRKE